MILLEKSRLFLWMLLLCSASFAYGATDSTSTKHPKDNRTVAEMTAKGNKVFVTANHMYSKLHMQEYLREWGYWEVVDKREDADFILQVISDEITVSEHKAYAVINEPVSGKARYKTGSVNTLASISFHGRKAVIRRLFRWIKDTIEEGEKYNDRVMY